MPTQDQIETAIAEIVPGGKFPASKLNPLLSDMLSFSSELDVYDGLEADGTSLLNTKLTLIYGINLITTSTMTNYACKLPKPVTGRRLTVINRSNTIIKVYPSMAGGRINLLPIDAPITIPPDGNGYIFNCIENPLPGAWTVSAPAIAQYDSGDITTNTIPGSVYSAVSPTLVLENDGFFSSNTFGNDGLNKPSLPLFESNNPGPSQQNNYVAFKPSIGWNAIVKIKVYTNLAWYDFGISNPQFAFTEGSGYSSYDSTGAYVGQTPGLLSSFGNYNFNPAYGACDYMVPLPAGDPPLPIGTLLPNIGDPGSAWGELVLTTYNSSGSRVGTFYEGLDANGNDYYFTRMVNFQINPFLGMISLTGFKFRFFVEYM